MEPQWQSAPPPPPPPLPPDGHHSAGPAHDSEAWQEQGMAPMELGFGNAEGVPPAPADHQARGEAAWGVQPGLVDALGVPPYTDAGPAPGYASEQGALEAHQAPPPPEPPQDGAAQQWLPQEGPAGHAPPAEAQQMPVETAVDPWVRQPGLPLPCKRAIECLHATSF